MNVINSFVINSFPTLFESSVTGKIKIWSIRVLNNNENGSIIETTHGYHGGKLQILTKTILNGKNIGKKNETTPYQQALFEAETTWQKKKDGGYKEKIPEINDNNNDNDIITKLKKVNHDIPAPMLAHDFNKRGKEIHFPCYIQPKLDGVRCLAVISTEENDSSSVSLFSRTRKLFPHLHHIINEISLMKQFISKNLILDGELYSDTLGFQEIVGLVKKETLNPMDDEKILQIHFHIYDVLTPETFQQRWNAFSESWNKNHNQTVFAESSFIHLVKTEICESFEKMKEKHNEYVNNGYEGIMLRNIQGKYNHSRSINLQKYKEFQDDEYTVVGFKEGQGLEKGCVVWECETSLKKIFLCRPRGSREERQVLFSNGNNFIGKQLTVRFQELTDDGIPRFPVGIAFRDTSFM
jgi:DNA ligase-1